MICGQKLSRFQRPKEKQRAEKHLPGTLFDLQTIGFQIEAHCLHRAKKLIHSLWPASCSDDRCGYIALLLERRDHFLKRLRVHLHPLEQQTVWQLTLRRFLKLSNQSQAIRMV